MHFRFKPRRNPGSQSQHRSVNRTAVVAGTNQKAVEQALDRYGDSTIGVMDKQGNIVKRSTR